MEYCYICERNVRGNFDWLCRRCFTETVKHVRISNNNFSEYIYCSFGLTYIPTNSYRFKDIHKDLSVIIPNLKPLANILENILILKLMACRLHNKIRCSERREKRRLRYLN